MRAGDVRLPLRFPIGATIRWDRHHIANSLPAGSDASAARAGALLPRADEHPRIEAQRIGIMGFSWGGVVIMLTATAPALVLQAISRGVNSRIDCATFNWSRRQESNLYLPLRRRPFYPLNYGERDACRANSRHAAGSSSLPPQARKRRAFYKGQRRGSRSGASARCALWSTWSHSPFPPVA